MGHQPFHSSSNSDPSTVSIMVVAGEASGDKHGASLARALAHVSPDTRFEMFGAGGDEMRAAGVETLVDAREVAIIGVPEIARSLGSLYKAYRVLISAARRHRPDCVVLIDWPDFNMRLARRLHREGFKIVYYVSPQVWAWRKYRVRALKRDVDRMLVILPFEREFYEKAAIDVEYVGHPLANVVNPTASREEFCKRHNLDPNRPIIALLPGSRRKEIHYHLPLMIDAARRLADARITITRERSAQDFYESDQETSEFRESSDNGRLSPQFIVPLASTVRLDEAHKSTNFSGSPAGEDIRFIERDTYNALIYSEFAVVASGTATVEAALAGTPMLIIYRGSELNWRLIRPLIHLDTFGMVNLIAGRRIVPELIQHEATADKISAEARAILEDPDRLATMKKDLRQVREALSLDGVPGPERAAKAVLKVIARDV